MAATSTSNIIWIICLILYIIALLGHFGVAAGLAAIAPWCWIIGFGLLLVAGKLRGL
jgi:hypothetical protein